MIGKSLWMAVSALVIILCSPAFSNGMASKEHIMDAEPYDITTKKNITITVSYDNNQYKRGIKSAWGFFCMIRISDKTILFDTGGDGRRLLANMERLGIWPEEIGTVVLFSHPWQPCWGA
jgi:hypothetical protein